MAVPLSRRNLFQSPTRLLISVGGIALAALLVLALDGVFAGAGNQVTEFMDNTPFDVVVSQKGVKNLHMTTSFFPDEKLKEIRRLNSVLSADPILFTTTFLVAGDGPNERSLAYLIGYEPGRLGGPWQWVGRPVTPGDNDIVVDQRLAHDLGLRVGDELTAAGRDFKVAGLDAGTMSIVNSIAFVSFKGFEEAQGVRGVTSFALVKTRPGVAPEDLVGEIERKVDGVTVQTRAEFAANERRIVSDMSIDIMRMMNLIAFVIGLAVTALTVYTATLVKLREYGVMRAIGARISVLYGVVIRQAIMSLVGGLALAVLVALALQAVLAAAGSTIPMAIESQSLLKVAIGAIVLGLMSATIPIVRIAGVKPAEVFRR